MRSRLVRALIVTAAVVAPSASSAQGLTLELQPVVGGLTRPLGVVDAGDGSGRLFVVQQTGEVLIFNGTSLQATPFLDVSGDVACCGEQGLLGLAVHPDYAANGRFFVDYTDTNGDTRVVEYQVSADPDIADPASARVLLTVDQPYTNHNGGNLQFGLDGYLYVGLGDGGGGGDPEENGQDPTTLLGSILRIDVDASDPPLEYAIPSDNPFVGNPSGRDEIWVYGLRNPWRFSFDRLTGDLFIGDVGQGRLEEIDLQPASSPGGENFGWDVMEGSLCYEPSSGCDTTGLVLPILEYGRSLGRSVTGGYRYRGAASPRLDGVYLFADYVLGTVWGTVPRCDGQWEAQTLLESGVLVSSFGEDAAGELFLVQYSSGSSGAVHRLVLATDAGGPAIATTPEPVEIPPVHLDQTGAVEVLITNTNLGPEAALVADLAVGDAARFSLDPDGGTNPCGGTAPCLGPGEGCTVTVSFSSSVEGAFDTTLAITGNLDPVAVPVSGVAYVPCSALQDPVLEPMTVSDTQEFTGCRTLTTGTSFVIQSGGDVTFRAGERITLTNGFSILNGGAFTADIDMLLTLP